MVGGKNPGPKAFPRNKRGREKREHSIRRATARGAMERSRCVKIIERKVRENDLIEYFLRNQSRGQAKKETR